MNISDIKINYIQSAIGKRNVTPIDIEYMYSCLTDSESSYFKHIAKIRSGNLDKQEINKEKLKLPAVLTGVYKGNNGIKDSFMFSNAMIFDFDDLDQDIETAKNTINNLDLGKPVMVFASPRGNRMKAIYATEGIYTLEDYNATYIHYNDMLASGGFTADSSRKDGSQEPNKLCFLSYDKDTILNTDFTVLKAIKYKKSKPAPKKNIEYAKYSLIDELEEARDVLLHLPTELEYNDWIKVLAGTCSHVGLHNGIMLMSERFPEQKEGEYNKKARSMLNSVKWGSVVYMAKEYGYIPKKRKNKTINKTSNAETVEKEIIVNSSNSTETLKDFPKFWNIVEGIPKINMPNWQKFLRFCGFCQIYDRAGYYRIDKNNILNWYKNEDQVKQDVRMILENIDDKDMKDAMDSPNYCFRHDTLTNLPTIKVEPLRDTRDCVYMYMANGIYEIKKENNIVKVNKKSYKSIGRPIYKAKIQDISFDYIDDKKYLESQFFSFCEKITGNDYNRLDALMINIGYMISNYKNPSKAVALVLQELEYSPNADGGTGKGLICKAIKKARKCTVDIDGKGNMNYMFLYDNVDELTDIVIHNDIKADFDIEGKFSLITDDFEINIKGEKKKTIPYERSPKFIFSTNYRIRAEGGSSKRRKAEIGLVRHYHERWTPEDDFGEVFFSKEWSDWDGFYHFIFKCIEMFLIAGSPIDYDHNLNKEHGLMYTLIDNNTLVFFREELDGLNKYHKAWHDIYIKFIDEYSVNTYKYSMKEFKKDIEAIAKGLGYNYDMQKKARCIARGHTPYPGFYCETKSKQ